MLTVLVGGVGGAKLACGLAQALPAQELTVVVNTADDIEWHGLYVAPDVDTVLYTLAGRVDPQLGWGVAGDSTVVLQALAGYGFEPWFRVGDRDLATHIARTVWLKDGCRYTVVVDRLRRALGVGPRVLPMSDQPVRTIVHTAVGDLPFQEYFVRRQAALPVEGLTFAGLEAARPTPEVEVALREADAILIGPSNPFVSIGPILGLPGVREALRQAAAPVVAVSPIIAGRALKGPAARMLRDFGYQASAQGVAGLYADLLDGFVIDRQDAALAPAIEGLGVRTLVTDTVMLTPQDRVRVAREAVAFAGTLRGAGGE